jgi:uncharacterized protein (UPF0212 family)
MHSAPLPECGRDVAPVFVLRDWALVDAALALTAMSIEVEGHERFEALHGGLVR